MPVPDKVVINPLTVAKDTPEWGMLVRLLNSIHTQDLVHPKLVAGAPYFLDGETQVELTHTIVGYFKTSPFSPNVPKQRRFDILQNADVLGQGGSGTVNKLAGKMVLSADNTLTIKVTAKPKIIKEQAVRSTEDLTNEMELMLEATHLNARHTPVGLLKPHDFYHYMVMRRFPAHLDQMMESEEAIHGSLSWSLGDRYLLSLRLLEALKTQMFDKRIIHGDIKPQNICLDADKLNVRIIDVGAGRIIGSTKDKTAYSIHYEAPELLARHHPEFKSENAKRASESSDVFSMGRVLARLWGDWNFFWQRGHDELMTDASHLKNALKYEQLFTVPDLKRDMSEDEQLVVLNLLKEMTAINPEKRLSIEEATNQLRVLEFNHRLLHTDPEKRETMQAIFPLVNVARMHYLEAKTPAQRFAVLFDSLSALSSLPQTLQPDAVREWKNAFHEDYYEAAHTVEELMALTKQLAVKHEKMTEKYTQLINLVDELAFPYRFNRADVTRAILHDFDGVKSELMRMKKKFTVEADVDDLRYLLNKADKRYREAFQHIKQNAQMSKVVSELFSEEKRAIFSSLMRGDQPEWVSQFKMIIKKQLENIDDKAIEANTGVLSDAYSRRLQGWLSILDEQSGNQTACLKQLNSAIGSTFSLFGSSDPLSVALKGLIKTQQKELTAAPRQNRPS